MKSGTQKIIPTYSQAEVFVMIEMIYGAPPSPVSPWSSNPRVKAASDYYNELTSFLYALFPDDIVRVNQLREQFYHSHGIWSFSSA
jgi:hypothetical protein